MTGRHNTERVTLAVLAWMMRANINIRWIVLASVCVVALCVCIYTNVFYVGGKWGELLQQMQSSVASRTTAYHYGKNASEEKIFLIPSDDVLRKMSEQEILQLYWRYVNTLQVLCRNTMRHGVLKDGGKEVCIDEQFVPKRPCLVYSFGSELRFDFEDSILRAYGCEIHTFDPSIKIDAKNEKKIPKGVTYHEIGLDKADYVNKRGWKMQTLPSAVHSLQHDNRVIDILKIDVEGGEWSGFQIVSHFQPLDNVKQLCIELHFGRVNPNNRGSGYMGGTHPADQLRVLRMLYEKGFRIFMREHMMWHETHSDAVYGPELSTINEISLINLRWKARR